jgi:hypothetical protein
MLSGRGTREHRAGNIHHQNSPSNFELPRKANGNREAKGVKVLAALLLLSFAAAAMQADRRRSGLPFGDMLLGGFAPALDVRFNQILHCVLFCQFVH